MNEIFSFSFFNSKRFLKSSLSNNLASAVPTTTISNVSLGLSIKARKDELKKLQEKNSIRSLNQSLIFSKNIKIK